jgi:signal transduction histidine kinase/CheY-like chemotaxis protein/CHASE3 domain sensor protein
MNFGFKTRLAFQFGLATAILIGAGAVSYRSVTEFALTVRRVEDSYTFLRGIDRILATLKDAESGQYSYLLSDKSMQLESFEAARVGLNHQLDMLDQLTASDPERRGRASGLRPLLARQLAQFDEAIDLRKRGDLATAIHIADSDQGKQVMAEVQSLIVQIEESENALLRRRSTASARGALWAFTTAIVANLLLMGFAFRSVEREMGERRRSEAALSRLASATEFAAALNQNGMLDTYQAALRCINRVAGIPLAVVYDVGREDKPEPRCAVGPDQLPLEASMFAGDGLPAAVMRTGAVEVLAGPFSVPELRLRFGIGEVTIRSVVGWPILFQDRCIGALVTAHLGPLDDERRGFVTAALGQLAVRMHGFQVEQHRLKLLTDLQVQSQALETARHDAERASRVKSEFLANMSHELRTPMNSIMGFTQRLLKKLGATLPERELDALQTVDRNAKHLLRLINSILDLSKVEAGKVEIQRTHFDLRLVIREAADQSAPLADGKPVAVKLELPDREVPFDGDRALLGQVVLNLLSNGIKFTVQGTVTIALDEAQDETLGRVARIAVRDTGIGIKAGDRARLFQEFTQLDGSTTRKAGGTGLGLVISARFVHLHGGRIEVASEHGRGSEFTVLLPLEARSSHDSPDPMRYDDTRTVDANTVGSPVPSRSFAQGDDATIRVDLPHLKTVRFGCEPPSERGLPRATILCVDDQPDILKFLKLTFEDAGYEVQVACDYDGALKRARAGHPDLICLDLCMPGKDGFQVMNALRDDPGLARVPVVVVSISREEARVLAAGARCYLAKPVESDDLVATVREILALERGSVLVVEDDPDTLRLLATTLAEHGLHVRTACNGREALDRLAEATPDAIVLDLMMPVMDGLTFLGHIQRDPVWSKIPVVILTAKTLEPAELAQLNQLGAAILTKGRLDTEQVVDAILRTVRSPLSAGTEAVS